MNLEFTGWPLAEAIERTTHSKNINTPKFWTMLERAELVAFGRRQIQLDHEWIPAATCASLTKRAFKTSTASEKNAEGHKYFDIIIYPVLHAPNATHILHKMLMKDAFEKFVRNDPEVRLLGSKAIKANPQLTQVYLEGRRQPGAGWEWPCEFLLGELAGGRSKGSPVGFLADPVPQNVQKAANVMCDRYSALLELLRQQKLAAVGDPVRSRGSSLIPFSIWSHRSYCFNVMNGDVLQKNENPTGFHDLLIKRWSAVFLQSPELPTFHDRPPISGGPAPMGRASISQARKLPPHQSSTQQAIETLWPNKSFPVQTIKARDRAINNWQRKNEMPVSSSRTIRRYLKATN